MKGIESILSSAASSRGTPQQRALVTDFDVFSRSLFGNLNLDDDKFQGAPNFIDHLQDALSTTTVVTEQLVKKLDDEQDLYNSSHIVRKKEISDIFRDTFRNKMIWAGILSEALSLGLSVVDERYESDSRKKVYGLAIAQLVSLFIGQSLQVVSSVHETKETNNIRKNLTETDENGHHIFMNNDYLNDKNWRNCFRIQNIMGDFYFASSDGTKIYEPNPEDFLKIRQKWEVGSKITLRRVFLPVEFMFSDGTEEKFVVLYSKYKDKRERFYIETGSKGVILYYNKDISKSYPVHMEEVLGKDGVSNYTYAAGNTKNIDYDITMKRYDRQKNEEIEVQRTIGNDKNNPNNDVTFNLIVRQEGVVLEAIDGSKIGVSYFPDVGVLDDFTTRKLSDDQETSVDGAWVNISPVPSTKTHKVFVSIILAQVLVFLMQIGSFIFSILEREAEIGKNKRDIENNKEIFSNIKYILATFAPFFAVIVGLITERISEGMLENAKLKKTTVDGQKTAMQKETLFMEVFSVARENYHRRVDDFLNTDHGKKLEHIDVRKLRDVPALYLVMRSKFYEQFYNSIGGGAVGYSEVEKMLKKAAEEAGITLEPSEKNRTSVMQQIDFKQFTTASPLLNSTGIDYDGRKDKESINPARTAAAAALIQEDPSSRSVSGSSSYLSSSSNSSSNTETPEKTPTSSHVESLSRSRSSSSSGRSRSDSDSHVSGMSIF